MIALYLILAVLILFFLLRAAWMCTNYRRNRALEEAALACRGEDGLWHGQAQAPLGELRFGYYPVARSGCGALAAANALAWLGAPMPLSRVIAACEWGTFFLGARVGLNPVALLPILALLCRRAGLRLRVRGHFSLPDELPAGGVLLVTHLNGRTLHEGAHTVMLYPDGEGGVCVANIYNNSSAAARMASPAAYLRGRRLLMALSLSPR